MCARSVDRSIKSATPSLTILGAATLSIRSKR